MNENYKNLFNCVNKNIEILKKKCSSYSDKIISSKIKNLEDFRKLPFMTRDDLEKIDINDTLNIVRIHSTSGTTGNPIIIPYTERDIKNWCSMMARCYEYAGVSLDDVVQISVGYGLWTAGIGFQLGCEKIGATAVPVGCNSTEKQFAFLKKMKSSVICATASFALYLSENAEKKDIFLKKGIFGSEVWTNKTRNKIKEKLGIEVYDIYGLTEVYGPGIAINCNKSEYMHYWNDYLYFEIIDPETGMNVSDGDYGELVITTLKKEGLPLIRYRTHDITRIIPKKCDCGSKFPQIDSIIGRTDDMIKYHGVKIFPSQISKILDNIEDLTTEYFIKLENVSNRDIMTIVCETVNQYMDNNKISDKLKKIIKDNIGINVRIEIKENGELERNFGKTKRVYDLR